MSVCETETCFFMWQIELKNVQDKKRSSFSTYHIQYRLNICPHWSRSWVHWCYVSACQYLQKRYQIVFKTYIPIQWFNATCWTGRWSYNLKLYNFTLPCKGTFIWKLKHFIWTILHRILARRFILWLYSVIYYFFLFFSLSFFFRDSFFSRDVEICFLCEIDH